MREIARFVMQGRIQAIGLGSIFGGISLMLLPVSCLSAAVVGLVGLRKGWQEGLTVLIGSGVIILMVSSWVSARPGITFPLVLVLLIPVLACVSVLRKTESQGLALLIAGIFSAAFVIVMHLSVGDVVSWWSNWLSEIIKSVQGASPREFQREGALKLMNGLVAMMFGMGIMAAVFLSRWWQALLYYPGGFAKEFHELRLPRLVLPGAIAVLLLAGSVNQILLADLFLVALMMFFFQGLAVIHGIVAKRKQSIWWTAPIYIGFLAMPQYLITGLAIVGAVDHLVRFRATAKK